MRQQLSTLATHQEQEQALMKAQSLLPFLLLLPCLTSRPYKILPPASMQHVASTCTFQSLFILSIFLSLFFSLLLSSCVSGVSLGKILNLKGLLNNPAQPCIQEIKPFCTFSIYHSVLQSKVLIHTYSLQPFGDWLLHLREAQVNFHLCVWTLCLEMWIIVHIRNTNGPKYIRASLHGCQRDLSDKQNPYQVKT